MQDITFTKVTAYIASLAILGATYYALVLYPYALDADIKLWLTGLAGSAATFIFGDQVASRTSRQNQTAFDKGLASPAPPTDGVTVSSSSPSAVTIETPPTETAG